MGVNSSSVPSNYKKLFCYYLYPFTCVFSLGSLIAANVHALCSILEVYFLFVKYLNNLVQIFSLKSPICH